MKKQNWELADMAKWLRKASSSKKVRVTVRQNALRIAKNLEALVKYRVKKAQEAENSQISPSNK
jgi:hypothetical protein